MAKEAKDDARRVERTSRTETAVPLEETRRAGLISVEDESAGDHPDLAPFTNGRRPAVRASVASRDSTFEADNADWKDFAEESTTELPAQAPEDLSHSRDDKPLGVSSAKTAREIAVEEQQAANPGMPQGVNPLQQKPAGQGEAAGQPGKPTA